MRLGKNNEWDGFSLLELIIAMGITFMLTGGVVELYLGFKESYSIQQDLANVQENSRLASFVLRNNIRMAGYSGCNSINIKPEVHGYNSSNAPEYLRKKMKKGTDVIVIEKADEKITTLTKDAKKGTKVIFVAQNPATKSRSDILISNCEDADRVKATSFGKNKISLNSELAHSYNISTTEIGRFTTIAYFVAKTGRKDSFRRQLYALYSSTNKKRKEELVEGVDNMIVEYGVASNNETVVNKYVSATNVADWGKVRSVLITLYFRTKNKKTSLFPIYIALKNRRDNKN